MATLALHVTPKAGKDQLVGVRVGENNSCEVVVRVTAAPEGGAANKAVCKLLAKELGVPKSSVSIKRGETSRYKLAEVPLSEDALAVWISSLSTISV